MSGRRGTVRWVAGILLGCLLLAGGWFAALRFESPTQRDASTEPPPAGPITAEVIRGTLSQTMSARAVFEAQHTEEFLLSTVASPSVVTANPASPGATIANGGVVLEVNGRPVFVLTGEFPFYRDLTIGDAGPDVEQLQRALVAAGYPMPIDGAFGYQTARGLSSLYTAAGYSVPKAVLPPASASEGAPPPPEVKAASLKMGEVLVISTAPVRLDSAPLRGAVLDPTSAVVLSSGDLFARVEVAESVVGTIPDGADVSLEFQDGTTRLGTVQSVSHSEDESTSAFLTVVPSDAAFPLEWRGQGALAILTLVEAAPNSLIVPTAAIVTSGGDEGSVLKRLPDGSFLEVQVIEIAELAGRSAVTVVDGDLAEGDLVKIG